MSDKPTAGRNPVVMRDFARVGTIYGPHWPARLQPELDPWDSLELMLGGYLYERQGSPRVYAQVAVEVVREMKEEGLRLNAEDIGLQAWERYATKLAHLVNGLNLKNNPLAPRALAGGVSVVELARDLINDHACTVNAYVRRQLDAGQTESIHVWIKQVNGVGAKIASFVLRDVAITHHVSLHRARHLLQPVDVWVRRCAECCLDVQGDIGRAIVEASIAERVSDPLVNAGMWYFGARLAGSPYRLKETLRDRHRFWSIVEEHLENLRSTVERTRTLDGP